ncbi:MAG: MATE family efflux transporter [Paenibacillus macerans]|uniref:Probable multidrug resistance protein NorM n=1 Tax=Paenibacillus macerans TaxID=44252 RepID=A0A090YJF3_PAEMA|nr:MATE family efflux transporter [Paenibacillus macerans]KFM98331.1 MATE efflux family protein [Paenibacillus macerans]MCY7562570.1 MATE family efflux transporter [Paenibacillus macerans]MDU7472578.1 MATE family efflux transporter [Paenibacillus macerans]MEC0149102.1 MATE family efflux transporter [Paenibacillus macerans]MUG25853.1 MATE family efflux transporter [Paenibacillus macerans]
MKVTNGLKQKYGQFIRILIPILVTQVTMSLMTFFDTMMSGHASPADLAGTAIGSSLWVPVQTGLSGILMGITPIVSQLVGGGRHDKVGYHVIQALWFGFAVGLVVLLAGGFAISPLLNGMNLEPKVHHVAFYFLAAISTGILPLFGYIVLRSFIDALGQTRTSMIITLISLPLNVGAGYLLIFGHGGFPRLGGIGSGIASAFTYWCIFLIAVWIVHRSEPFASYGVFRKLHKVSLEKWRELTKLGVPIGFAIFFETAVFAAVTLLMSRFDTLTIAAHQAANNFASTLYMIPLSICLALTILVGFETGAARLKDARQYAVLGVGTAAGMALVTAVLLMLFRQSVAEIYSSDPEVVALTKHFLIYAIFFQLSDAIATPTQGVLRGYKDVNPGFWISLLAYWIIGLPLGFVLANYTPQGPYGYWIGLITGLAVAAVLLLRRLVVIQRRIGRKLQAGEPL